jgi:hypothetical protein
MCGLFNVPVPAWADTSTSPSPVSVIRNATMHESLFMDAPLGFALHRVGTNQNLTLEMQAMTCRFLVALIGDPGADYVRSPVTTRQMEGWVTASTSLILGRIVRLAVSKQTLCLRKTCPHKACQGSCVDSATILRRVN